MYKFDPAGEPVEASFRAIALSQLDEALADLDRGDGEGRSVVHEARRRCKKLRGLLRLVRPAFADFATENAAIRDAAAGLSHLRDAEVLHQTVVDLGKWRAEAAIGRIEQQLAAAHDPARADKLDAFRAQLLGLRQRAVGWSLQATGCAALMPGLRVTYRSGRRWLAKAERTRVPTDVHEWRKASKNHGFHIDLLKKSAPELLAADLEVVDRLSTLLGVHHDLTVLLDASAAQPERFGGQDDVNVLIATARERRDDIEQQALELGRQIFAERPRAVAERFTRYWKSAA